jgi:signal transduction histidine kinase
VNFLGNARDAIVATSATLDESGSGTIGRIALALGADNSGEKVVIAISDTGGGISEELVSKVLDPFITTKAVGKGTGLRLSISFGIVTEMGGDIRARNVSEGAEFVIRLPCCVSDETSQI